MCKDLEEERVRTDDDVVVARRDLWNGDARFACGDRDVLHEGVLLIQKRN